jgi:hypothetical protein
MSVGATDTFSQTRDEIIADALANVGALGPGETASGPPRDHAARALNRLVKAIDAEGQFLWRVTRLTFTTTASTASYTLNATAFDVDEPVSYLQTGTTTRVPLRPMSRDDFMSLPDRTTAGRNPARYFIEKTLSGAGRTLLTMTLYPVPNTSSDTVEYAAAIRAKDYVTGSDTSDFPTSWIQCLVYGLTAELAPAYNQAQLAAQFRDLYLMEKDRQLNNDNEKQGIMFVPFGSSPNY